MTNIVTIAATQTDPVLLNETPLAGGSGREAKAHLGADNAALATGVVLEGHNGIPSDGAPDGGDAGWFTVLEGPFDAEVVEIDDLPQWVRVGAAVAGPVVLEGVQ